MKFSAKDILTLEVAPALGCTEPVAIAPGAAAAASLLTGQRIARIEVWVDPNIYKNGLAVVIPGSGGLQGLDRAAAIGAFGGKAELKLEVLSPVTESAIEQAESFVKAGGVQLNLLPERKGLYIRTVISGRQDTAESEIVDAHDNLVKLALNGDPVALHALRNDQQGQSPAKSRAMLEAWLKEQSLAELIGLLDELDRDDLDFIEEGLRINLRLAESGLTSGSGLGVGTTLERLARKKLIHKDMILDARILTSAAADARMAGVNVASTDGIVGESPEQTMRNIGTLSTEGMIETDRTILKIMMAKKFSADG